MYPFVRLFVKTSVGHFFTNRQPCYVVQLIYVNCVRVHCYDVCNIASSTCISVNWVEIPLHSIRSDMHETVVLYKTMQSFCSDVVVQNVNVISSPVSKVVCFKIHHFVSPNKCCMLETFPFAVTPSIRLTSLPPLSPTSLISTSPPSSPLSSSSPLSLNRPSSLYHPHFHF